MLYEDPQSIKTNRLSAKVFLVLLGSYTLAIVTGVPSLKFYLSSLSGLMNLDSLRALEILFSSRAFEIILSNLFSVLLLVTNFVCNLFLYLFLFLCILLDLTLDSMVGCTNQCHKLSVSLSNFLLILDIIFFSDCISAFMDSIAWDSLIGSL